MYKERDEKRRQEYLKEIQYVKEEDLFYVDESGIEKHLIREYARAPRGEKVVGEVSGKKFERQNIIAAWNNGKVAAPMGYKSSCDAKIFETWVEKVLVKQLVPGKVVVMDNAAFHRKKRLTEIIESVGCKLIFLPPYSPDLNPIEHFWDWLKNKIRDTSHLFPNLELAIMAAVNEK